MTNARRLDPRIFPSETGWLLVLLGVTILMNAWSTAQWRHNLSENPGSGFSMVFSLITFLSPGLSIYSFFAWLRVRRTRPLAGAGFIAAGKVIEDLAWRASASAALQVRLGPKLGIRTYVAGMPQKPYLVLGPELLILCDLGGKDRSVFEAVVRHELGHLRGNDLRWYQLATALRMINVYTVAWFVLVPVLALTYDSATIGQVTVAALRATGLILLAELIARMFLRVREHHADLYAAEAGTVGVLDALGSDPESSVLRRWLRRHPGRRERSDVLVRPGVLLTSGPGQVFLGATTAGVLLVTLQSILLDGPDDPLWSTIAVGMLVGVPLALFVGITIWRSIWHAVETTTRVRSVTFGAALFTGLLLGSHLSPFFRVAGMTGIPFTVSVLLALAVCSFGLSLWLTVLGTTRARVDPWAAGLGRFLSLAGLCACAVGAWTFATLWTWSMRVTAVQFACDEENYPTRPVCRSVDTTIAQSVAIEFGSRLYPYLVAGLVAASMVAARMRRHRWTTSVGWFATIAAATVLAMILRPVSEEKTPLPAQFRPVLNAATGIPSKSASDLETARRTRQSWDRTTQQRTFAEFECPADDPLHGSADPTYPLITCSADGTEKFLLGPVALHGGDIESVFLGDNSEVVIAFTSVGDQHLYRLTTDVGLRIAILVNDTVLLTPTVHEHMTHGPLIISESWPTGKAEELSNQLSGR